MAWCWRAARLRPALPCLVTFTRLGPGTLDDDNLAGCFKHVQDQVAKELKVDDGDRSRVRFAYAQEKSKAYGVRVTVEPLSR